MGSSPLPLDKFITLQNYGVVETLDLIAGGETLHVEFKTDLNDDELVKALACLTDYVGTYGSITRGQAAELCQLSPPRARTVLKGLVDEGVLVITGQRRGARYVLAHRPPVT